LTSYETEKKYKKSKAKQTKSIDYQTGTPGFDKKIFTSVYRHVWLDSLHATTTTTKKSKRVHLSRCTRQKRK
jgi:hypothetical protein